VEATAALAPGHDEVNHVFVVDLGHGTYMEMILRATKTITLWLFNSSPWYRWPIEIDGLPIKNGDFPWLC